MESTGSYWKPIYNQLEDTFELIVANPQHIKALPGRKTDVGDAEWIADLLQHGLIRSSFIPSRQLRELRELTRYRKVLIQERAIGDHECARCLGTCYAGRGDCGKHGCGGSCGPCTRPDAQETISPATRAHWHNRRTSALHLETATR